MARSPSFFQNGACSKISLMTHTSSSEDVSIRDVLDTNPPEARHLPQQVQECLAVWQEFLDSVPKDEKVPHPLWSMEFGATYPFKRSTPSRVSTGNLRYRYRGSHGSRLSRGKTREEVFKLLPSHARVGQRRFPSWKITFIERNRQFYKRHKLWIDIWKKKIRESRPVLLGL